MRHIEHQHQCALIDWARRQKLPEAADINLGSVVADYLLAIPNGGRRDMRESVRLKKEGVKAGVSDLLLALPRSGKCGLWLELKAPGNKPTLKQTQWMDRMQLAGYAAHCAYDWVAAAKIIQNYLRLNNGS